MMPDEVDMSLEDIIERNKGKYPPKRRRGPRRRPRAATPIPFLPRSREVERRLKDKRRADERRATAKVRGPLKLLISNLEAQVSTADIIELFSEFGPLISATVHYSTSGRSLRTAEAVYEFKEHALAAMKYYNGITLDGVPMVIQVATYKPPSEMQESSDANHNSRKARRSKRAQSKKTAEQQTAEQLDAELDAYTRQRKIRSSRYQSKKTAVQQTVEQLDAELDAYTRQRKKHD